jgi:hypothetical protein
VDDNITVHIVKVELPKELNALIDGGLNATYRYDFSFFHDGPEECEVMDSNLFGKDNMFCGVIGNPNLI